MIESQETESPAAPGKVHRIRGAVVRFTGDSGDGMQVTGDQFTFAAARARNDLATLPDFPAEIRAPAGTTYGVSGFQINFASEDVFTPGDRPDVLVAMNPAALRTNLRDLKPGGLLILNSGELKPASLKKTGYEKSPLDDGSLDGYDVMAIDITKLTQTAVAEAGISTREAGRCKNFWTLGLMFWMYGRPLEPTIDFLGKRYKERPELVLANTLALKAGHAYGETAELAPRYEVPAATVMPGVYRQISGNAATALGLVAAAQLAGRPLLLGAYPITPASDLLHELSKHKTFGVTTIQAEDEIAAVCAALGASYAGSIGVTTSSGPGIALKMEAIGLAVATELPLVIVDVQRGGPSTGLPTKTEQADLMQVLHGRNGEAPVCILSASTPSECFAMAIEAVRLALKFMTPVFLLTDGYLANGAEPWRVPDAASLPRIDAPQRQDPAGFTPYLRDPVTLARPWAVPGTPGLRHRIGGLEKDYDTGNISYAPENHEKMVRTRAAKIAGIANHVPEQALEVGDDHGKLLVIGWGSTYGAIREAVTRARARGHAVSHAHLRYLNPLPRNLGALVARFEKILVPELNLGQLVQIIRATFVRPAVSCSKVEGQPFKVDELEAAIDKELA